MKYKSPLYKLVIFFERSRDNWKSKCKEARYTIKILKSRIAFLETSKAKIKEEVKQYKKRVFELERKATVSNAKLSSGSRNNNKSEIVIDTEVVDTEVVDTEVVDAEVVDAEVVDAEVVEPSLVIDYYNQSVYYHHYQLGIIFLFISLVLNGGCSIHGCSGIQQIFFNIIPFSAAVPNYNTGRLWILRLGLYKLTRPKEISTDWIVIIDHSVQTGALKCFVAIGIRQCNLPPAGQCIDYQDIEPIIIEPVTKSNSDVVKKQLETIALKVGVPRAIVADKGSDILGGCNQFCEVYRQTDYIYDVKHKTANELKRIFKNNPSWQSFTDLCSKTKSKFQQTDMACFAPPKQRTKARYMNIDTLIEWAVEKLYIVKTLTIFTVNQDRLNALKTEGVPDAIIKKLVVLCDTEYKERNDFIEALNRQIGDIQTIKYQEPILKSCCTPDKYGCDTFQNLEIPDLAKKVSEKLSWIYQFETILPEWEKLVLISEITCDFVRKQGFSCGCAKQLEVEFEKNVGESNYKSVEKLQERLLEYVEQESAKCKGKERLPGSSEIIESIFGTQKQLEKQQVKSGFTQLILGIAARISQTTAPIVKKALETISTKKISEWTKKYFRNTVQSRKKRLTNILKKQNKNGTNNTA